MTAKVPVQEIPLVDLRIQYEQIKDEILAALRRVMEQSQFILGKEVENFEKQFAEFCGVPYCVGVNSGTSAVWLALLALGIGPGDEVITSSHTFVATSEAISWTGAKPVFADIDEKTYTLDPAWVEKAVTPRTKAILAVHLYGHPAAMDALAAAAEKHKLLLIEDAAQAHGARYRGKKVGTFGHAACFSFFPGKNLGAYGEAGAVVTSDKVAAEWMRKMRNHGRLGKSPHEFIGFNCRMEGMQGAVLGVKLRYLDSWNQARRENARRYHEKLQGLPLVLPRESEDARSVYHLYVVRTAARDALHAFLHEQGIRSQLHYETPNHLMPFYRKLGYQEGNLPVTEKVYREILSLPMYPELSESQIDFIAACIRKFFDGGTR